MRRKELIERIEGSLPVIQRCDIGGDDIAMMMAELGSLDGPGVSRRVKWMKVLERACVDEQEVYRDFTPQGWKNLEMIEPRSPDLKRLRMLRKAVRTAWSQKP